MHPVTVDSEIENIIAVASDESKQARQARKLRSSEARQRLLLSRSPDVLFTQDQDLRYTFVLNPPGGLAAEHMIGQRDDDLVELDEARALAVAKKEVLATGRPTECKLPFSVRGNTRWYSWSLTPERDEIGSVTGVVGYARDITSQHRAEAERNRAHRQIIRTQRLEGLGSVAAIFAHDFNNLLVSILGNASLAQLDLEADHPAASAIDKLVEEAQRATALTRGLLAYADEGSMSTRPTDVSACIREIHHLLSTPLMRRVALDLDLADDLPHIEVEPLQMQQLVMNLVLNASEAMAGGNGKIIVRTRLVEDAQAGDGAGTGDLFPSQSYLQLDVSDDGPGVAPDIIGKLFDPGFSTRGNGRGTGLAAVRAIVRAHRGEIRVSSTPGEGTTFRLLLPAGEIVARPSASAAPPIDSAPPRPDEQLQGEGIILIVDDEPGVRATAGRALVRYGYRVLFADSAAAAGETFSKHARMITGVLLDATIGDMDSAELLGKLRDVKSDVAVVLSSGFDEATAFENFAADSRIRFVHKPYEPNQLAEKIKQAIEALESQHDRATWAPNPAG